MERCVWRQWLGTYVVGGVPFSSPPPLSFWIPSQPIIRPIFIKARIAITWEGPSRGRLWHKKPTQVMNALAKEEDEEEFSKKEMMDDDYDAGRIRECVSLARTALGRTAPNPMVGCVIVKDGQVVGRGFHPKAGEPHAEVFALREAGMKAEGATAYVSLEPCSHYGRTPPCCQALIKARVKHVVVGMVDPNPIVAGNGISALRKSGISVHVGVEEDLCRALNESYIHRILNRKPFVTLRYTMSLDGGFVGSTVGDSGIGSYYSKLLQENDAVIVTDESLRDDPHLVSLEPGAKQPLRIVLARTLCLPLDAHVFDTSIAPTLVISDEKALVDDMQRVGEHGGASTEALLRETKGVDVVILDELDLDSALDICYERGFSSVLFDCRCHESTGALQSLLGKDALEGGESVQKVVVAIAPILCGENKISMGFHEGEHALKLERVATNSSGKDIVIEGYLCG